MSKSLTTKTGKHYCYWVIVKKCKSHHILFFPNVSHLPLWILLQGFSPNLIISDTWISHSGGTCLCLIKGIVFWEKTNKLPVCEVHSENGKCKAAFIELSHRAISWIMRVNKNKLQKQSEDRKFLYEFSSPAVSAQLGFTTMLINAEANVMFDQFINPLHFSSHTLMEEIWRISLSESYISPPCNPLKVILILMGFLIKPNH